MRSRAKRVGIIAGTVPAVFVLLVAGCSSTPPADDTATARRDWVTCISNAVKAQDDGVSDPVIIADGIEPQCAVQHENVIQVASQGLMTDAGKAEARRVFTEGELQLVTSAVMAYRATRGPSSGSAMP